MNIKQVKTSMIEILSKQPNKKIEFLDLTTRVDISSIDFSQLKGVGARGVIILQALNELKADHVIYKGEGYLTIVGMCG